MTQMNNIIRSYNRLAEMERFISYVRLNPECNRKEAILDLFGLKEQELETMLFFGMINFNNHIDSLEEQLNKMKLLNYENYIYDELYHLHKQYPSNRSIQYELFILDENDEFAKVKLNGVSAFTDWDGRMCFVVLPDQNVCTTLKSVVTHEYHHHWRISGMGLKENEETMLDRLVLEGLAEHFVRIRLGEEYIGPYKDALSETQAKSLWENIYINHIYDQGAVTDMYMFGDEDKGIPFWSGYAIGYYLIKWFLDKNKDISIEEVTLLPSDRFL